MSDTHRTIVPTRWQPREKGWQPLLSGFTTEHLTHILGLRLWLGLQCVELGEGLPNSYSTVQYTLPSPNISDYYSCSSEIRGVPLPKSFVDTPARPWKFDFLYTKFSPIYTSISIPILVQSTQICSNCMLFTIVSLNTPNLCNLGSFLSDENPLIAIPNFVKKHAHIHIPCQCESPRVKYHIFDYNSTPILDFIDVLLLSNCQIPFTHSYIKQIFFTSHLFDSDQGIVIKVKYSDKNGLFHLKSTLPLWRIYPKSSTVGA